MKENLYYLMTYLPPIEKDKPIPMTPAEIMNVIAPESDAVEIARMVFGCLTVFNALMLKKGIEPPLPDIFSKSDIEAGNLPEFLKTTLLPESPLEIWQAYYNCLVKDSSLQYWGWLDLYARNLVSSIHNSQTIPLPSGSDFNIDSKLPDLTARLKAADRPEAKDRIVFDWELAMIKEHLDPQPFSRNEFLLYLITLTLMLRGG